MCLNWLPLCSPSEPGLRAALAPAACSEVRQKTLNIEQLLFFTFLILGTVRWIDLFLLAIKRKASKWGGSSLGIIPSHIQQLLWLAVRAGTT